MKKKASCIDRILSQILVFALFWLYLNWMQHLFFVFIVKSPLDFLLAIGHHPLAFDFVFYFDNGADGIYVPALESSSSSESLTTFRGVIAAENEAEIYQRIRTLESQNYYNLPPQNHPGDYERLVREHFDQAINVDHFRQILDQEFFELTVLERKGLLQENLFNLMLSEHRIDQIMELSPFNDVRREAYNFLQEKVGPLNDLRHPYQRHLMDGSLNFFIHDINQHGRNAEVYRQFYDFFTDAAFRRVNGLPLP
jgi:hypothetical protein